MKAVLFMAIGSLTTWLTMLAPITILICWYLRVSLAWPLIICAFIAPILFVIVMSSLRGNNSYWRWSFMQMFGAGSLLMSLIPPAAILTSFISSFTVAILTTVVWICITCLAIRNAHNIHNISININSALIRKPVRLVQISDVHIGSRSGKFLHHVVEQVNSHRPDFVLITGDLLDSSSVGKEELSALSLINADAYMCLGNHERYVDLASAIEAIEHHNVTLLRNSSITSQGVQLIGIDDYEKPDKVASELTKLINNSEKFRILLYHKPDGWQAAIDKNIQLTLAGHTHAGQVWPFGYLVRRQYPWLKGKFQQDQSTLYVSQGTGTWGPTMRFGTNSEMTVIDLLPSDA